MPAQAKEAEPQLSLPLLSSQWWQSFLHGNADALLAREDAKRALDLMANRIGKEAGQLDVGASIRVSELRKTLYAKFRADLALYTMQSLWPEAANTQQPGTPVASDMPETVAKFFEPEEEPPPWRWESAEDRAERQLREGIGGWSG